MYVLIHSYDCKLDYNNVATGFSTYELAYEEMVRQYTQVGTSDGSSLLPPNEYGAVYDEERGYFVGCILEHEAWIDENDSTWVIFDVKEG